MGIKACIESSLKIATLLVNRGANVNAIDNDWWTPLHAAAACDHWRIVSLLLSNGANTDVVNVDGDLPLEIAEGDKTRQVRCVLSLDTLTESVCVCMCVCVCVCVKIHRC